MSVHRVQSSTPALSAFERRTQSFGVLHFVEYTKKEDSVRAVYVGGKISLVTCRWPESVVRKVEADRDESLDEVVSCDAPQLGYIPIDEISMDMLAVAVHPESQEDLLNRILTDDDEDEDGEAIDPDADPLNILIAREIEAEERAMRAPKGNFITYNGVPLADYAYPECDNGYRDYFHGDASIPSKAYGCFMKKVPNSKMERLAKDNVDYRSREKESNHREKVCRRPKGQTITIRRLVTM